MKYIILGLMVIGCGATILEPTATEAEMRRDYPEQFGEEEVKRQDRRKNIEDCVKTGYDYEDCRRIYDRGLVE